MEQGESDKQEERPVRAIRDEAYWDGVSTVCTACHGWDAGDVDSLGQHLVAEHGWEPGFAIPAALSTTETCSPASPLSPLPPPAASRRHAATVVRHEHENPGVPLNPGVRHPQPIPTL